MKTKSKSVKINEKEFIKKFKSFSKHQTWTKEKHDKKEELVSFISEFENIQFLINYHNNPFGFSQKSWELKKYKVPQNKLGHLKKYRDMKVLLLNIGKKNMFKLEIIALPIE